MIRSRDIDNLRYRFSYGAAVCLILNYFFVIQGILPVIVKFISVNVLKLAVIPQWGVLFIYAYGLVSSCLFVWKPLKASFVSFKKQGMGNVKIIAKWVGFSMLFQMAANFVIANVLGTSSLAGNQATVIQAVKVMPLVHAFAILIFAPIVEELVFRGALYQQFRNERVYKRAIVVSALLFASIHVLPTFMMTGQVSELLYYIPYGGMVFFMIAAFEETGSIVGSMGVHFVNNAIAFLSVISLFRG